MNRLLAAVMMLSAPTAYAVDASEVGPKLEETAQTVAEKARAVTEGAVKTVQGWGRHTEDQRTYSSHKAFELKGTIKDAGPAEITVARPGLPLASLDIRDQTKVTIDGKPAKASDLKEGAKVRALFQLEGAEIVAVRVNARSQSASGTGGAGAAGGTEKKAEAKTRAGSDPHGR